MCVCVWNLVHVWVLQENSKHSGLHWQTPTQLWISMHTVAARNPVIRTLSVVH